MRYHYQKPEEYQVKNARTIRVWNHPVYKKATLITMGGKGLCIIQQRQTPGLKTYWDDVDPWLVADIHDHPKFWEYFGSHADYKNEDGFYPAIPVRKVMWALRMKPMKKEVWETTFDREFV